MRLLGIICNRGFNSNIYMYMPIIQRIYLPAILLAVFVLYVYGEKTSYWWILKEAVADINDIKVIGARPFHIRELTHYDYMHHIWINAAFHLFAITS